MSRDRRQQGRRARALLSAWPVVPRRVRLLTDDTFTTALRCRWEALREGALSDDALMGML